MNTEFLQTVRESLDQGTFARVVLGKYRGPEADLMRAIVRRVTIQDQPHLSILYRYRTRDITKNLPIEDGLARIGELLGETFKSGHLFTLAEDVQIEFSRKGKPRLSRSAPTVTETPDEAHNVPRQHMLDPHRPFLHALGVTDRGGNVIPRMAGKWRQVNKFVEILQSAVASANLAGEVHVVDFGCGKGYLTFAAHDFLRHARGLDAHVTGVEQRPDLVKLCNDVAAEVQADGLRFVQGDILSFAPQRMDVMIALHACDTATDDALYKGLSAGAAVLLAAPCCHKELRPQLVPPEVSAPLLRHGIQVERQAELLTDGLRAMVLEACGYRTQVFEFVSGEHTQRNTMVVAVKRRELVAAEGIWQQVDAAKAAFGIRRQRLDDLVRRRTP